MGTDSCLDIIIHQIGQMIDELEAERDRLRKFVEHAIYGIDDPCDLFEKAIELGLIEERPSPQPNEYEYDADFLYQCVWTPKP